MALTLTAREHEILAIVIREMNDIPSSVDFNVIAPKMGQKYARNARSAFKKIWDKLKSSHEDEAVKTAASDGDDVEVEPPKVKAKAPPKKTVGQRKAPAKAAGTGRKGRPTKREREAKIKTEAALKQEAESGDDADGEGDTTGFMACNEDMGGDSGIEYDGYANKAVSPDYKEDEKDDEEGAAMLGISLEEFRALAGRAYYGNGRAPPTPQHCVESDDEV